jgi:hypothetical protein
MLTDVYKDALQVIVARKVNSIQAKLAKVYEEIHDEGLYLKLFIMKLFSLHHSS